MNNLQRGDAVYVRDYAQDFHRVTVWSVKGNRVCVVSEDGLRKLETGIGGVFPICVPIEDVRLSEHATEEK